MFLIWKNEPMRTCRLTLKPRFARLANIGFSALRPLARILFGRVSLSRLVDIGA